MPRLLRTGLAAIGLMMLAASLSACIIEDHPGHGWCYWHPSNAGCH